MHELAALCHDANNFPQNFPINYAPGNKHLILEQLNTQADRLFANEAEAALDFLELDDDGKGIFRDHEQRTRRAT